MSVIQYTVKGVGRATWRAIRASEKPGTMIVQMVRREESWLCQGQQGSTMLSTFIGDCSLGDSLAARSGNMS